jgi:hypothetical protein
MDITITEKINGAIDDLEILRDAAKEKYDSGRARAIAITITQLEIAYAYYQIYVDILM